MRKIEDIDFKIVESKIWNQKIYYLYSSELKSIDPVAYNRIFEPMSSFIYTGIVLTLKKDDIVLDIGANIGYYSMLSSWMNPDVIVHSFEPHPKVFEVLEKNSRLRSNIFPHNCGIGESNKSSILYCDNKNVGGHSFKINGFGKSFNNGIFDESSMYKINCDIKSIDQFNIDLNNVKLIKIDVQDMEVEVLRSIIALNINGIIMVENTDGVKYFLDNNKFQCIGTEDNNIFAKRIE